MRTSSVFVSALVLVSSVALFGACSSSTPESVSSTIDAGGGTQFPVLDSSNTSFDATANNNDAAGNDDASTPVTFNWKSGSRLKVRGAKSADGDSLPIGFRDSTLNQNCTVNLASDGTYRCLPTFAESAIAFTGIVGIYADKGCTQPVARVLYTAAECATPKHVLLANATANDTRYQVYPVGTPYSGPLHIKGTSGNCSDGLNTPGSGYLIDPTKEVAASTYAKMTSTPRTVAGVSGRMYIGDDASEQLETLTDSAHGGWDCALTDSGVFAGSCVPTRTAGRGAFSDPNCATAVAFGRNNSQAIATANDCSDTTSLETIGAAVAVGSGSYYTKNTSTGACTAGNLPAISSLYSLGSAVAANSLLTPGTSQSGSTRLVKRVRTAPASTSELYADAFYDTALKIPCTPQFDQAGQARCLPVAPLARDLPTTATSKFSDPACTDEVVTNANALSPCVTDAGVGYWRYGFTDHSCSDVTLRGYRYIKLGTMMTNTALYIKSGGSCIKETSPTPFAWPATSVDATTFAPLTESVE